MRPGRAHNDYLNTLADWGLIGGVLVAGAWAALFWAIVRTWRFVQRSGEFVAKPSSRAAFVLGGAVGLLAILIHSLTDFNMHIPANAIMAVSLMAMLTGYLRFATERHWVTASVLTRMALTCVALIGGAYLARQGADRLAEQLLLDRAEYAKRSAQKVTAALPKVWKDPTANEGAQIDEDTDWALIEQLSREIQAKKNEEFDFLKQAFAAEPMNAETSFKIGEILRERSWGGQAGFRELATEALVWLDRAIRLNPYSPYHHLRYGMCLDKLGRPSEGGEYIRRAVTLDPKNHYIVAHLGWHHFQLKEYPEAKRWFEESLRLSDWRMNPIAVSHLNLIKTLEASRR